MSVPVTVIAAVWSQQADKEALLRGHMANLDRQTVEQHRIYVFDDGDRPPAWLRGTAITARESLTLYQAWNVALSLTQTPFVMNLNVDDRLAPDAIEVLLAKINSDPEIYLVGGDWKICGSADETEAVERSYPLDRLPSTLCWPPAVGVDARIGSGDGLNTASFGPASLWRMDAHMLLPRYPYRFGDGSLIKVMGDAAWWGLLRDYGHKKTERVPLVIGNYRTWPMHQAEFRPGAEAEAQKTTFYLL